MKVRFGCLVSAARRAWFPLALRRVKRCLFGAALRPELAATDEPALFVSRRGGRISHRMIQLRLSQHAVLLGLPRHVHPHAAPLICFACAAILWGFTCGSGDVGACKYCLNAGLYPS